MGVSYDVERGVLCLTAEGVFTTDEVMRCIEAARSDPRLLRPVRLLSDVSRSASNVPEAEVRRRIAILGEHAGQLSPRIAVVVGANKLEHGLARMGAARAESGGFEIRPFATRDEALDWLTTA